MGSNWRFIILVVVLFQVSVLVGLFSIFLFDSLLAGMLIGALLEFATTVVLIRRRRRFLRQARSGNPPL
jgi:hypothetical protein